MSHIIASAGVNYAVASKVGGTGTLTKIFPGLLSGAALLQMLEQTQGQIVTFSASGSLFVNGTSPTINAVLQSGTSLTAASNTTVSTLTAVQSLTTANAYPFTFIADLQGDAASGKVQVVFSQFTCNNVTALQSAMTNTQLTGVKFGNVPDTDGFFKPEVGVNLVFGITFGVSDALNAASLFQYQLES